MYKSKKKKIMIGSFSGRFPPFLGKKGLKLKIRQKRSNKSEKNHKKFLQTDNFKKKKIGHKRVIFVPFLG